MGTRLVALAKEDPALRVAAAIERPDHPLIGRDAGEIAGVGPIKTAITGDLRVDPAVLIDFSAPASMRHWLKSCRDRKIAMLIGTTGLQWGDQSAIDQAAADIPVLQATNMSLGVALLSRIVAQVAKQLGDDYDIEIVEAHHRFKKDAPSGTAMTLAESILQATGKTQDALAFGRRRRAEEGADRDALAAGGR